MGENVVQNNKINKLLLAFKIVVLAIYALTTIFLIWVNISTIISLPEEQFAILGLVIYTVYYAPVGYGVALLFSVAGLIISKVKKTGKKDVVPFILGIVLPIVTELLFIIVMFILSGTAQ
ncbi:MAG: hypothetical protein IKC71_00405 [Clostridia bacterium]|nr:hypothetical protein [Clostridia bacterium]